MSCSSHPIVVVGFAITTYDDSMQQCHNCMVHCIVHCSCCSAVVVIVVCVIVDAHQDPTRRVKRMMLFPTMEVSVNDKEDHPSEGIKAGLC
jgi:hypothetical protein